MGKQELVYCKELLRAGYGKEEFRDYRQVRVQVNK